MGKRTVLNSGRRAIIVLGMHRSGTSAVAGTAVRLGGTEPRTPLAASDDNPWGFYESYPVVYQNYAMLLGAGCAWDTCLGFKPPVAKAPSGLLARTLREEFGESGFFVVKDPRLCLTLPVWLPVLRHQGVAPAILVVCRHPAEVAASLLERNAFSVEKTAALWLHHMLEAEHASRGFPRAAIFYDDLLHDWRREVARASLTARIAWPRAFEAAAPLIDQFLAPAMRHQSAAGQSAEIGEPAIRGLVQAAWLALHGLRDEPASGAVQSCLDEVRRQFAVWRGSARHDR